MRRRCLRPPTATAPSLRRAASLARWLTRPGQGSTRSRSTETSTPARRLPPSPMTTPGRSWPPFSAALTTRCWWSPRTTTGPPPTERSASRCSADVCPASPDCIARGVFGRPSFGSNCAPACSRQVDGCFSSKALVRQPGGFEGLGFLMLEVDLDSQGESRVVEGQDRPRQELRLDAAARPSDRRALMNQDSASVETNFQRFDYLRLERVRLKPGTIIRRSRNRRLTTGGKKLDFGMNPFHCCVEIAPVVSVVVVPPSGGDLGVLLRHRLVRQPGGFEGFVFGMKAEGRSDDFSVAELVQVDLVDIDRDPARLALSPPMGRADHCIRGVGVFLAVDLQVVEGIGPEAQGLSNRFDALNNDRLIRSVLQVLQHSIWCEGLDDAVEIPSVQSSNSPFRHLDVLLRHQLRSIARRVLLSRQSSRGARLCRAYSRARLRAPPSSVSSDPSMRGSTA